MRRYGVRWLSVLMLVSGSHLAVADVPIDLSEYDASCRVRIEPSDHGLDIAWPIGGDEYGRVALNFEEDAALVDSIAIGPRIKGRADVLTRQLDPVIFLTVGSRRTPENKPDDQAWQVFFDKPSSRPHETFLSELDLQHVKVTSHSNRATVSLDALRAGGFNGSLEMTFYADCRLIHVEAVMRTTEKQRAILYDAGLLADRRMGKTIAWTDTEGQMQRAIVQDMDARPLSVRHRAIYLESEHGTLACFSPPHQFHFPRDWTDNFAYVWFGNGHRGVADRFGIGVRQDTRGGRAFVPWFNAPPNRDHRMGVFYVLSRGSAEDAKRETLRYTNGDRFPDLPGYLTMTSHWHMAIAVAAMELRHLGVDPLPIPDFVDMFKSMNVDIVHLGEFHGDGHQRDPGPLRLPELQAMFDECRRLSDDELLLIPGEEVNTHLGLFLEQKHPGHWMSLFPRPVFWTMTPDDERPFVEEHSRYGTVYHVGDRADMIRLIREQRALVWAAHPRIKASSWTPDIFRHEDFFVAESWLGGAWKHLPADLSEPRLGQRALDLLDDMANWGNKKYVLGEVDVFQLDHTHELYGHMNVNYLKMSKLPRFDDGWQSVLDVLRAGTFFVTTGEILIPHFSVGGKSSGDVLVLPSDRTPEVRIELNWTFPLKWVEIISGDGRSVYRERIDVSDTTALGSKAIKLRSNLRGRHWVRCEAWDVACNGAYTQPVWLTTKGSE